MNITLGENIRRLRTDSSLTQEQLAEAVGVYRKFDEYIGAYADEMDVMLEEVYLLGAADREKMLR